MKKHQKKAAPVVEHTKRAPQEVDSSLKKSMQLLKKKTALLSAEFEAEERTKR